MTDIHSERLTKQNVYQNLSQTSKIEMLNFSTRIISHSSRLYVHWGHFGLEDSTLIVVALVLPSSPSLSLASQTLSGVWLARLPSLRWKVNCCSACAEPGAKSKVRQKYFLPGTDRIRNGTGTGGRFLLNGNPLNGRSTERKRLMTPTVYRSYSPCMYLHIHSPKRAIMKSKPADLTKTPLFAVSDVYMLRIL